MMKNSKKQPLKLSQVNFQYKCFAYDDYSYNDVRHCSYNGCFEEGICRCGTIENATILAVSTILPLIDWFATEDELTRYCVDRILTTKHVYSPSSWNIRVSRGYYGEEVDGIFINDGDFIETLIHQMFKLHRDKKVEFALEQEYGYVHDNLKNLNWRIETIDTNRIRYHDHMPKITNDLSKWYKDYDLPVCLCKFDGGEYRMYDGNHRLRIQSKAHNKTKILCGRTKETA